MYDLNIPATSSSSLFTVTRARTRQHVEFFIYIYVIHVGKEGSWVLQGVQNWVNPDLEKIHLIIDTVELDE